jgi:hypothetical protein
MSEEVPPTDAATEPTGLPTPPSVPPASITEGAKAPVPVDLAEMRKAYNAFRKRLKAMQLETDSKLGRSPLTGRKETLTSIQTPTGFGRKVWQDLADAGYLKYEGQGLYTLMKKEWGDGGTQAGS